MILRAHLARRLRFLADRIDPDGAFRLMTAVSGFTFEEGLGIVFRDDIRGCPLWYRSGDYDRAHEEAGNLDAHYTWLRFPAGPGEWKRP